MAGNKTRPTTVSPAADLAVLEKMVTASVKALRAKYP
jgi:hypothetical protein